jgi:hypothetical protein
LVSRWNILENMRQGKGEVVEVFQCRVEPFAISGESSETGGQGEASFDDPASWQQDETALSMGV